MIPIDVLFSVLMTLVVVTLRREIKKENNRLRGLIPVY